MNRSSVPRVSVVMPAYNAARYIREAIDSVLQQQVQDLELIVVDDGSTDETAEIAAEAATADPRVRIVRQPNSGKPAIARNRGIRESRGEIIAFLDADDVWRPEKLETCLRVLDERPDVDLVFHDVEYLNEDGTSANRYCLGSTDFSEQVLPRSQELGEGKFLCSRNALLFFMCTKITTIYMSAAVIRRGRLHDEPGFFAKDLLTGEDLDLWLRIVTTCGVAYVAAALSGYRIHRHSVTRGPRLFPVTVESLPLVRHAARCRTVLDRGQFRIYRKRVAEQLINLGYTFASHGRNREAMRYYWHAIRWRGGVRAFRGLIKASAFGALPSSKKPTEPTNPSPQERSFPS